MENTERTNRFVIGCVSGSIFVNKEEYEDLDAGNERVFEIRLVSKDDCYARGDAVKVIELDSYRETGRSMLCEIQASGSQTKKGKPDLILARLKKIPERC